MDQKPTLSHRHALRAVEAIRSQLEADGRGAAVAVCDDHGELIAFVRTDGCRLPSINIAVNKAYTAAREQTESKQLGELAKADNFPVSNFGGLRYIGWGGGLPITRGGIVIGAVGVSGLEEEEDIEFARFGVAAVREAEPGDET